MQQVTFREDANIVAGQAIARSEFGITEGLFWNESGDAIAFYEKNESAVSNYPLLDIESTPGSLREIKYPMAGQGSEYARVGVLHKGKKKAVYLETDGIEHDQYLTNLSWSPDGKTIVLAIVNRAQNNYDVVAFNAKMESAVQRSLASAMTSGLNQVPGVLGEQQGVCLVKRADGFMNLYLYNTKGALVRQLTDNEFVATGIVGRNGVGIFYSRQPAKT